MSQGRPWGRGIWGKTAVPRHERGACYPPSSRFERPHGSVSRSAHARESTGSNSPSQATRLLRPISTASFSMRAGRRRAMAKIRPSGGYRNTASFQTATIIYDGTYWFCEKFLDPRSRTVDQMVQAARSGRQNIAEGSRAAATSSQTELRLLNVARSSLEELLLDFEDYLRHRRLPQWAPDSQEALAVRKVPRFFKKDRTDRTDPLDRTDQRLLEDKEHWALYAAWLEHDDPLVRANALICLINQANYLLDQQTCSA